MTYAREAWLAAPDAELELLVGEFDEALQLRHLVQMLSDIGSCARIVGRACVMHGDEIAAWLEPAEQPRDS